MPGLAYWTYDQGRWNAYQGTSYASPVTAGIFARVDASRTAAGRGKIGWLNRVLCTVPAAQTAFRDVTGGAAGGYSASPGWDYPTGWGIPKADALVDALP